MSKYCTSYVQKKRCEFTMCNIPKLRIQKYSGFLLLVHKVSSDCGLIYVIQAFYLHILSYLIISLSYLYHIFIISFHPGVLPSYICSSICSIVINNISIIIFVYDYGWSWYYEALYFFLSHNNTFAWKFDC